MSTPQLSPTGDPSRVAYVDVLRGLAIILMVLWHTADAWIAPTARAGTSWRVLLILGGLAAPFFFVVLGISLALRAVRQPAATARTTLWSVVCRGLELIAWGYLLRVQFWLIDDIGLRDPGGPAVALAFLGGYVALVVALRRLASRPRDRRAWFIALAGVALVAVGVALASALPGKSRQQLFAVDVLQALGAAMIGAGLVRAALPWTATPVGSALACAATALLSWPLTPVLNAARWPLRSYYLVALPLRPRGPQSGRFPILPWLALPFAGAAVGTYCQRGQANVWRHAAALAAVGGAVIACSSEYLHHVHVLINTVTGLAEPARLFFRLGILLIAIAPVYVLAARVRSRLLEPVVAIGRCSMLLYWIHLELVFGKPTWFLQRKLEIDTWCGFWLMTLAVLWIAAWVRLQPWASLFRRGEARAPAATAADRGS